MASRQRKPSSHAAAGQAGSASAGKEMVVDDPGYSSSEYSPMHGLSLTQERDQATEEEEEEPSAVPLLSSSQPGYQDYYMGEDREDERGSFLQVSSYVPPGYMVLDQSNGQANTDYERFHKFSVSSL